MCSKKTRDALAGEEEYMQLLRKGVDLIFLDNQTISTPYIKRLLEVAESQSLVAKISLESTVRLLLIILCFDMISWDIQRCTKVVQPGCIRSVYYMISLKEYAKKNNISYEAVRKQVNRYREELGAHIYKHDRTQYLDEEGEAFLDTNRAANPIIVVAQDKDARITDLEQEVKRLLIKADIISTLSQWKADKSVAIAEADLKKDILEKNEELIKEIREENAMLQIKLNSLEDAKRESENKLKQNYQEELQQ